MNRTPKGREVPILLVRKKLRLGLWFLAKNYDSLQELLQNGFAIC